MILGLTIGLILGLVIGGGAVWYWYRERETENSLRELRAQHEALRGDVAEHFIKTADLVNALTDSYKEVFDHLRDGAERLVDENTLRERLSHTDRKEVTIRMIGGDSGSQPDIGSGPGDAPPSSNDDGANARGQPAEGVEGDGSTAPGTEQGERSEDASAERGAGEPPDPFR